MAVPEERLVTPAEYLEMERKAPTRSELINGRVYAMAGASVAHNLIVANLIGLLWSALRGTPCYTYPGDLRLRVMGTDLYTYPDVTVAYEPPEYDDDQRDTLLNPTFLIEVLSPSTEGYDRGAKFAHYRRLPSLREFWLVSTDRPLVERYVRDGDLWVLHEHAGLEAVLPLSLADFYLPLADVYSRVEFSAAPRR